MRLRMETKKTTTQIGAEAEEVAAKFYQSEGFKILARNYRLKMGELDLVVVRGPEVRIIEVKSRKEFRDWEAQSPLWREKKRRLWRTTQVYLDRHEHILPPLYVVLLDIVFVTQGRVSHQFEGEPFV